MCANALQYGQLKEVSLNAGALLVTVGPYACSGI